MAITRQLRVNKRKLVSMDSRKGNNVSLFSFQNIQEDVTTKSVFVNSYHQCQD